MTSLQTTTEESIAVPPAGFASLGIIIADPAIGGSELLRRLLKRCDGTNENNGPVCEAIGGVIDFNIVENSAVQFAPHLDDMGNWARFIAGLMYLDLRPAIDCDACRWCESRDRYTVLDKHGLSIGHLCNACGNFAGMGWLLQSASYWPSPPPVFVGRQSMATAGRLPR